MHLSFPMGVMLVIASEVAVVVVTSLDEWLGIPSIADTAVLHAAPHAPENGLQLTTAGCVPPLNLDKGTDTPVIANLAETTQVDLRQLVGLRDEINQD